MNTAAKRTIIAAAAVAAASLVGSLSEHGTPLAHQGLPTVHRDVALVDLGSDIVSYETTLDNTLYGDLVGTSGAEYDIYNAVSTVLGSTDASTLLDTTTGATGIFDGSATNLTDGLLFTALAGENELDSLLGVSSTTAESAIIADITADGLTVPSSLTDTLSVSTFDGILTSAASTDFASASTEFVTYLDALPTILEELGGLGGLLGDLGLGSL